jgi:hypothetical protein
LGFNLSGVPKWFHGRKKSLWLNFSVLEQPGPVDLQSIKRTYQAVILPKHIFLLVKPGPTMNYLIGGLDFNCVIVAAVTTYSGYVN